MFVLELHRLIARNRLRRHPASAMSVTSVNDPARSPNPEPPPEEVTGVFPVLPPGEEVVLRVQFIYEPRPKPVRRKVEQVGAQVLLVSDRVLQQFVMFGLKHEAGLQDYLDERSADVIFRRRRQRLKEKSVEQVRNLERDCLVGRVRTVVDGGIDTGRRTTKGYRIIRIQRGERGPIYFATVNDRDRRLVGFYTSDWFRRPKRRKRLAHRRQHSTRS
jgi:hypothetical protein